ncbi:MAG: NAD-dependent epimerase/dehydratase family protein [Dehalococcoidia bacterium]|nr:NAD-dependent epimerase/dehydratase family protein [Dehalococcoidia bacterium]MDP7239819.1 NAD-dependent epimerase/dehydratase family protein [Dehalococcoidia bacterium]
MKALVTGGAGFIGSHIVEGLVGRGWRVVVVDNLSSGERENIPPGAEFRQLDITTNQLIPLLKREKSDVVFHLAAHTSVTNSMRNPVSDAQANIIGGLNLIQGCMECGTRKVIYASSGGAVYGESLSIPVDEGHSINPYSAYGISKYTVESYLRMFSAQGELGHTVLRLPNVYGPRQKPTGEAGVVAIFAYKMLRREQPVIFGDGTKTRDYVYVSDIVQGALAAAERGDGAVYNLGTGRETSDREVFDAVALAAGFKEPPVYEEVRPGEIYRTALDASRAREGLGWEATVTFEEGVARTVEYLKNRL